MQGNRSLRLGAVVLLLAPILASAVHAAGIGRLVARSGAWDLHQTQDPMDDEIRCTGLHRPSRAQLTKDRLALPASGGPQSVRLRFDSQRAGTGRETDDVERRAGYVKVDGLDFAQVINAQRLRSSINTSVDGEKHLDLDLTGIGQALTAIRGDCTPRALAAAGLMPQSPQVLDETGSPASKEADPNSSPCGAQVIERMRAQGLAATQIAQICR